MTEVKCFPQIPARILQRMYIGLSHTAFSQAFNIYPTFPISTIHAFLLPIYLSVVLDKSSDIDTTHRLLFESMPCLKWLKILLM